MTEQMNLGGAWRMREADSETWHSAHVPGSVYADLMADGTMPDPFWRENELDAFERMKKDYVYQRTFTVTEAQLAHAHVELVCEGLDTLAHVSLNGREIAFADNMHITWVWDVKEQLHAGENTLEIRFDSPILYCAKKLKKRPAGNPPTQRPASATCARHTACSAGTGGHVCRTRASGGRFSCGRGMPRGWKTR